MDSSSQNPPLGGFDSFEQKLGDELRGERATLGKSLLDVQRDLRIKAAYISAIENCDVSVFPNASFVAGYVRSYARYLMLDPEVTFTRFCSEAHFKSAGSELAPKPSRKSGKTAETGAVSDPQAWVPQMPGFGTKGTEVKAGSVLMAAGPLLALALVVTGLGYGAWFLVQDIQRVEFAPIENTPMVALEPNGLGGALTNGADAAVTSSINIAADPSLLYNSTELEIPVVQPRDGPIFAINPDGESPESEVAANVVPVDVTVVTEGAPILRDTPHIPNISIVAQAEAWVRVYEENGTIIFEKTLSAGEQYALPADAPVAYLRAGNATSVYVMVDDAAYGPISTTKAVVRDIPLQPTEIASAMAAVQNPSVALQVAAESWREMNTAQISE